jgi:hypothetical protein
LATAARARAAQKTLSRYQLAILACLSGVDRACARWRRFITVAAYGTGYSTRASSMAAPSHAALRTYTGMFLCEHSIRVKRHTGRKTSRARGRKHA